MEKPSSDTSPTGTETTTAAHYARSAEGEALVQRLRAKKPLPRATIIKRIEAILYAYAEDATLELITFAMDRSRDDKARSQALIKIVEMVRPAKLAPLILDKSTQQNIMVSHLQVPLGEVGPATQPAIDVPPLRIMESQNQAPAVITAGELEPSRRALATPKEIYEVPREASEMTTVAPEYVSEEDRFGPELPERFQDGPKPKVTW